MSGINRLKGYLAAIILYVLCCWFQEGNCQPVGIRTPTLKELLKEGNSQYNAGHWFLAEGYFKRLFRGDTTQASLAIKIGICRLRQGDYEDSERWLRRGLNLNPSGPMFSEAYLGLSLITQWKGQNSTFWQEMANNPKFEKAILRYASHQQELQWLKHKESIVYSPDSVAMKVWPGSGITNSTSSEFGCLLYKDGLLIASNRNEALGGEADPKSGMPFPDIYRFKVDADGSTNYLGSGLENHSLLNTIAAESPGVFTSNGRRFYFTRCENEMPCKIYVTLKIGEAWSEPQILNDNVNAYGYSTKHPAINSLGDTLVFASNRIGGKGGYDLWFCTSEAGDKWGKAQPLSKWNTALDDVSPYYSETQKGWFWASDGQIGLGSFDIYFANGFNTLAQLLPYPINTTNNDYFPSENEGILAWSSDRIGGKGSDDIYLGRLPSPLSQLRYWPKFKKPETKELPVTKVEVKPMLDSLPQGFYTSEAIFFDFDQDTLKPASLLALDTLAGVLKIYPDLRIYLYGYTDQRGSNNYNKLLAQKRAETCYHYLQKKGVNANRMKIISVGKKSVQDTGLVGELFSRTVEVYFEKRIPKMKGLFMNLLSFEKTTQAQAKAIGFSESDFCKWNAIKPGPILAPFPIRFPKILRE